MRATLLTMLLILAPAIGRAQVYGKPDREAPGDAMIQAYLARVAAEIEAVPIAPKTRDEWEKVRPQYVREYFYMLGLDPMPEKTPLQARVTGKIEGNDYTVELLHFQSRPRLYVTANLYRPTKTEPGKRLPAVLYVCGHSNQGRNGNKTAYQAHGIWLARHGYACLMLDTLQLSEVAGVHHGTYRENRWWWHSRGYTPAGVECLNGIRGIDYLLMRPEVDPERIAVTGISGGGAATFWIAAADPRVKVAVPVSGMADLQSYVTNLVINGHCDCMFLYNTFQWPWTRIAALIAPRPMLFTNSDLDAIFPMDANDRVINRLERVYSLYGASDSVDAMVSIGGHAYREDLRRAIFRFLNVHLNGDSRPVTDSEIDLVVDEGGKKRYPIEPERLRVFSTDGDLPKDELNSTIDQTFVPMAKVDVPAAGQFEPWKQRLTAELRRVTFRWFPERIPLAKPIEKRPPDQEQRLESEPGIEIRVQPAAVSARPEVPKRLVLIVGDENKTPNWRERRFEPSDAVFVCQPRGIGPTRWTAKNPPNYVARSHLLLGRTVDSGRVWDIIAAARWLRAEHQGKLPLHVLGEGLGGIIAACAAALEPEIDGAILDGPPLSFMDAAAPPMLNILRVCDVPELLGLIAPKPLSIRAAPSAALEKTVAIYRAAGGPGAVAIESEAAARASCVVNRRTCVESRSHGGRDRWASRAERT